MIRVLRIMEYTYETAEHAERDMGKWQIAANGSFNRGTGLVIKSAIITDLNFEAEDD